MGRSPQYDWPMRGLTALVLATMLASAAGCTASLPPEALVDANSGPVAGGQPNRDGWVSVVVRTPAGDPVESFTWRSQAVDVPRPTTLLRFPRHLPDGTMSQALPEGTWLLHVEGPAFRPVRHGPVRVTAGAETRVELVVEGP